MTDARAAASAQAIIRHDALAGAVANAVINAGISAAMLRGSGPHLLTVDSIAAREHTILGSAVTLALSLGLIVGSITFFTFRRKARVLGLARPDLVERPYFFFGLGRALLAALTMAAFVVFAAVLWQRFVGSVAVSTPAAAALTGLVAGVTAWHVSTRTSRALLTPL
ncbi:MAG TPA: hypothetical protein VFY20_04355 [Gemmatimonadales bacterium]|nr:hypothetical protein [Gemmatimonadales bacterium]